MSRRKSGGAILMFDDFGDDRPAGRVLGTCSSDGTLRKGVDVERVIGIDNGALRISPLVRSGWNRSGISYGPFSRVNGLSFGVWITNGHNTSQEEPPIESLRSRLGRWSLGSGSDDRRTRLIRWVRSRQKWLFGRTARRWLRIWLGIPRLDRMDENLAIGWFPSESPVNPTTHGHSLIMHALGADCGELWARAGGQVQRTLYGLQNIPMFFLVVVREQGAAYYVASISGVPGVPVWPYMRLVAVDPLGADNDVFAGIHQCVLGQIGFRVDTRVSALRVSVVDEFGKWFGSAHGADSLSGSGALNSSSSETGQNWVVTEGAFTRTPNGTIGEGETNFALLRLNEPAGFIRMQILTSSKSTSAAILWRATDRDNYWCFEVGHQSCQLSIKEHGILHLFPSTQDHRLLPSDENSVQIADDGKSVRLYLNGGLVYAHLSDARMANGTGVGFMAPSGTGALFGCFEAHPRAIPIPAGVSMMAPSIRNGRDVVVRDDFDRPAGDLAESVTSEGQQLWKRTIGRGKFELSGQRSVKVVASVQKPNPGRTAYTIPWHQHEFADLEVNMTPPGVRRGEHEQGRGGLIFWMDARNYVTLNLWMNDTYGFSISSFFYINGYEELYDAVWTNIGRRVHWGVPFAFRTSFDGNQYVARINGEPVLCRALTDVYPDLQRLEIRRVGIVANWEWGDDTGSEFRDFVCRN